MATTPQVSSQLPGEAFVDYCQWSLQYAETAIPYAAFKKAGFEINFATENGTVPECDKKMLTGITQKLLVHIALLPRRHNTNHDIGCHKGSDRCLQPDDNES